MQCGVDCNAATFAPELSDRDTRGTAAIICDTARPYEPDGRIRPDSAPAHEQAFLE